MTAATKLVSIQTKEARDRIKKMKTLAARLVKLLKEAKIEDPIWHSDMRDTMYKLQLLYPVAPLYVEK